MERAREVEDSYQTTRAAIARLGMRSHADKALLEAAKEASKLLGVNTATKVRTAVAEATGGQDTGKGIEALAEIHDSIEAGYAATNRYHDEARRPLGSIVGTKTQPR